MEKSIDNELTPELIVRYLDEVVRLYQPNVKIVWKDDSKLMKILFYVSFMFIWNKGFMTKYITVVGSKIYVPKYSWMNKPDHSKLSTIIHEGLHLWDNHTNPLWQVAYFMPQVAFLLLGMILGIFVSPWCLLICLGIVIPLPAPWRFDYEVRAYRLNLMMRRRVFGWQPDSQIYCDYYEHCVEQMTKHWYFYAMPFDKIVRKHLDKWDGNHPYVREVMGFLEKENLFRRNSLY